MEKYNIEPGEQKAWRELLDADPGEVAKRSLAEYIPATGEYSLVALGETYLVNPAAKSIKNISNPGRKYEHFLNLSIPIYLTQARDVPVSGELVKELKGGEFFFRGSHTLPLEAVSRKYASDRELFLEAGRAMGGDPFKGGDAAFSFNFFPRVAMAFVLWMEDDEFPARATLLFDANADKHMALDVVWAVALLSCQRILAYSR